MQAFVLDAVVTKKSTYPIQHGKVREHTLYNIAESGSRPYTAKYQQYELQSIGDILGYLYLLCLSLS